MATKQQLINEITNFILTGGNRTSAVNVRQVLTDIINSYTDATTFQAAIAAHAGGGQGAATPMTNKYNRIDSVASDGDSVLMPQAIQGSECLVQNNASVHSANVYPLGADNFISQGSSVPFPLSAGQQLRAFCYVTGEWTLI
jgi:TRAP-type mannitol/chloroaromatic compound transport system substrate-binding protein